MKNTKELFPALCENADATEVKITFESWQLENGDRRLVYGSKTPEEMKNLLLGRCTQASLPEGCPFVSRCTGKIGFEPNEEELAVIFLTVSNPAAYKAKRTYRP